DPLANATVELEEDETCRLLDSAEAFIQDALQVAGPTALSLTYDADVASDPTRAYRRVCEHLGLEPRLLPDASARANPFPLATRASNAAEFEERFRQSRHAWMWDQA